MFRRITGKFINPRKKGVEIKDYYQNEKKLNTRINNLDFPLSKRNLLSYIVLISKTEIEWWDKLKAKQSYGQDRFFGLTMVKRSEAPFLCQLVNNGNKGASDLHESFSRGNRERQTEKGEMSDEEHHFESKADAGASKTYPQQAGTIRKNGYIVIKGRPCKVYNLTLFFAIINLYLGFCFFFDLSWFIFWFC